MAQITNNGKKLIVEGNDNEVKGIFSKLAGRDFIGMLYELYLEMVAKLTGLEAGTIELIVNGKVEDSQKLIDFADGKHTPKTAQPISRY